jgi:hypothetical membrane protein
MNLKEIVNHPKFHLTGVLGTISIFLACLITALGYRGPAGQRYSILNYFISELGGVVESELSLVFNVGIFIGGILLAIFIVGLYFEFSTKLGKIACMLGIISAASGAFVGVFPYDVNIGLHALTAFTFFYGGMATMILLSISLAIDKSRIFPSYLIVLGVLGAIAFVVFNVAIGEFASVFSSDTIQGDFTIDAFRPHPFWSIAFYEWLCLISIVIWMLFASIEYGKRINRKVE